MSNTVFYFVNHGHTFASMLREALEEAAADDPSHPFVHCTIMHPLDAFVVVKAPSSAFVRGALLSIRDKIAQARVHLKVQSRASATPG